MSPTSGAHILPALRALGIGLVPIKLDAAQMSALDDALAPEKISGPRYSPTAMAMVDR